MDVRSEVAEFFNRDGLLDYPDSEVRFLPDEVIFTPGTRAGLAFVLEVLGADGSGVVVPRPSWEYDWFVERAGKTVVELPTSAPEFLPDPEALDRLLGKGGISSVILNNPHNPTGRVYPRALVEDLVRVAVKHRCYVLYDSVYQRLDYVGWFVNPAFARPEWRDWVVSLSGLSKMDMFGASTGTRACWLVISDQIRANGVRAREILANLSAWLVATPSTLAQDWALAALQSPLAALRRPSPYMRERRDFMVQAADELRPLGVERTDFGGTFYSPLAFPGLVGEPFDRLRNGIHEKAVVKDSVDAFELLLSGGVGGIPFVAFAGGRGGAARFGTWQRLSYGSKDVKELAVFMDRVRSRITKQGRLGSSAPAAVAAPPGSPQDAVWESVCTAEGYDALDGLDPKAFAAARRRFLDGPAPRGTPADGDEAPRLHHAPRRAARPRPARGPRGRFRPRPPRPDPPRVEPAHGGAPRVRGVDRRPPRALQRGAARPRGTADQPGLARRPGEGRARPAAARDRPRRGPPPPLPRSQPLHRAGRGEGLEDPRLRRPRERPLPPGVRAGRGRAEAERHLRDHRPPGELHRRDRRRGEGRDALPAGGRGPLRRPPGARRRVPGQAGPEGASRGASRPRRPRPPRPPVRERRRPRAPARPARGLLPRAGAGRRGRGPADPGDLPHFVRPPRGRGPRLRRDVGHRRAEREDRDRRRLHARPRRARGGRAPPRRARAAALRARPVGHVPDRRRPGRLPRRLRPRPPGGPPAVRERRRRHDAGHPGRRARGGRPPRLGVPCRGRGEGGGEGPGPRPPCRGRRVADEAARGGREGPHRDAAADRPAPRALREPRAPDPRPHPRHGLGQLRALDPGVPGGVGRGQGAPRQPRPARRLAGGGHPAAGDRLQPRLHDPRPARRDERPRRPRPAGRRPPRPPRARVPRDRGERAALLREGVRRARLRPEAGRDDRPPVPARGRRALGRRPHPRGADRTHLPLRHGVPAVPGRGLGELGRDEGAREPDDPRGGADPRDVERRLRRALHRAAGRPLARSSRRWWTPRTPRAYCWPAS